MYALDRSSSMLESTGMQHVQRQECMRVYKTDATGLWCITPPLEGELANLDRCERSLERHVTESFAESQATEHEPNLSFSPLEVLSSTLLYFVLLAVPMAITT